MEILLGTTQLVQEERVFVVGEVNDKSLLLTCLRGRMQGYLDIQKLGEIFSILRP